MRLNVGNFFFKYFNVTTITMLNKNYGLKAVLFDYIIKFNAIKIKMGQ